MEEERKTQVESEDQQDFKFKLDVQLTALSTSLICRNSKGKLDYLLMYLIL